MALNVDRNACYRRDIRKARERVATGSRLATTSCGPIEYAVVGAGRPVLVIHGAGGGYDQGCDLGEPVARSGFRAGWSCSNDAAVTTSLQRYDLERIRVPALVISVADDLSGTFDSPRYTAEHIPGARFIGYETGGHVCVGHPDEVITATAAFLRELPATNTAAG